MNLHTIDIVIFILFIIAVVATGMIKSSDGEKSGKSYFLAGRGLAWWLIGISLIAANISTEQFVGMSGQAADYQGLAPASYEWLASVTLVIVAFFFLPYFLRTGIFTIPEFLEHRYNHYARFLMAASSVPILILLVSAVTYSGALTLETAFHGQKLLGMIPVNLHTASWLIGLMAAVYVVTGGLKACAWADLIQGLALIAGGVIITLLAFDKLGNAPAETLASFTGKTTDSPSAFTRFMDLNSNKLHMILPSSDSNIPWTALLFGLWIPNFYYWGLNQYITQRTLGAASLAEGQKGIVFAAGMKLVIPFIIIIPGMIAFNLYSTDMRKSAGKENASVLQIYEKEKAVGRAVSLFLFDERFKQERPALAKELALHNLEAEKKNKKSSLTTYTLMTYKYDTAFGLLISKVLPEGRGIQGFILAALLGAVVSSLAAMLNAASTIFSMDIFKKYVAKNLSDPGTVQAGRFAVAIFAVIGCLIAPLLGNPQISSSIFRLIQETQGYISPGILAVFVFGLIFRKAPSAAGVVGLLANPVLYFTIGALFPHIAFLNRMSLCFVAVVLIMAILTLVAPRSQKVIFKTDTTMNLTTSQGAKYAGIGIIIATGILYVVFQ